MSNPLPPIPQPEIVKGQSLLPPWQAWFYQLYTYLSATASGGGGIVNVNTKIDTTAPLTGGGDLSVDRTHSILTNGITNGLLAQMPTLTIKGNNTGGTANALDLTASQVKSLLAISLTTDVSGTLQAAQEPAHTGDVTNSAGSLATTIAANAVTNAKAAQMATLTIKGNNTGGTANALDLTVSQVQSMLQTWSIAITASAFIPSSSTVPTNGMYLIGANNVGMAVNSTKKVDYDVNRVLYTVPPRVPSYTVGGLPGAGTVGQGSLAMVTDATLTAITGLGLAPTGGGANKVMVYSDGAGWLMI